MSLHADDDFQKELIALFVQEAQEWLQQIQVALDELQQKPSQDRRLLLAQTIKAGLTNLGGSAATVSLDEIAQATFSALRSAEQIENPDDAHAADNFVALCKQLAKINAGLAHVSALPPAGKEQSGGAPQAADTIAVTDFILALQKLLADKAKTGARHRTVIQTMITKFEGEKRNGTTECKVPSIREELTQAGTDESTFLRTVQEQVPMVIDAMSGLRMGAKNGNASVEQMKELTEPVAQLLTAAQRVNATQAATFFRGLQSFLTLLLQKRLTVEPRRYEAVEGKLRDSVTVIEHWVEQGRTERTAIGALLPG